jgi:hypothetical protein
MRCKLVHRFHFTYWYWCWWGEGKRYSKDLILAANIDKRVFARGKEAIRAEVMSKVPFLLETGGYFPGLDHVVQPDISLEAFRYYLDFLREMGGTEKVVSSQ